MKKKWKDGKGGREERESEGERERERKSKGMSLQYPRIGGQKRNPGWEWKS